MKNGKNLAGVSSCRVMAGSINLQLTFWVLLLFSFGYYTCYYYNYKSATVVMVTEYIRERKDCSALKPITSVEELPILCDSEEKRRLNEAGQNGERMEQDDPRIINFIRDNCDVLLRPPDGKPTTYKAMGASMGQDEIVRRIFKNMTGGFYIEFGAYDGVISSNSLELERDYGWQGLLIEAGANEMAKIHQVHRNAWISHACVSVLGYPHEVIFHPDPGSVGKIANVILNDGPKTGKLIAKTPAISKGNVRMQCFPLYSFIAALNVTVVDFLSVDVEGLELQILKTIPFDKVLIKVLAVEIVTAPEGQGPYREFMESKGYRTLGVFYDAKMPFDLIFAHPSVPVDESVFELLKPKATGRWFH